MIAAVNDLADVDCQPVDDLATVVAEVKPFQPTGKAGTATRSVHVDCPRCDFLAGIEPNPANVAVNAEHGAVEVVIFADEVGAEAQVADELARYRNALGIDHMILCLQWPGPKQTAAVDAIERIARVAVRFG